MKKQWILSHSGLRQGLHLADHHVVVSRCMDSRRQSLELCYRAIQQRNASLWTAVKMHLFQLPGWAPPGNRELRR